MVSRTVHDQVRDKLSFGFKDMGEQPVKNIARPIGVYQVSLIENAAPITVKVAEVSAKTEVSSANRPSIAVLPFANISGDPEQEYFADGISEDIITGLSKLRWFFVIARNSSFTYKGKAVDVKRVAGELGVRYVLEGSVRKGGNRVRITAQLIDAATGNHIWADRYDGDLTDVFALQDEITKKVVAAIEPKLLEAEGVRSQGRSPEDLDAWDTVMQTNSLLWRLTKTDIEAAIAMLGLATARYPDYAPAHSMLAFALLFRAISVGVAHSQDTKEAVRLASRAAAGAALGGAIGVGNHAGHGKPMPVLHDGVAHIGELRLPSGGLAVKTAVGIAGTRMRVVLTLLSMKVRTVFVAAAVLEAKALLRSPGLDQRSVHRKMLVRQQGFDLRMVQKFAHELRKHLTVLQSVAVLRKGGWVPDRIVGRKPHEPPVQKIIIQLLHKLSFRPDAVEHLKQQCAQQLLRRDRGSSFARVELPQATVQLAEHLTDKLPDFPQRMASRNPSLRRDIRKQPALILKCSPHASLRQFAIEN